MTELHPRLAALEEFLRETVKANYYLTLEDLRPEEVVFQISNQLENSHFRWVDNTVYVPNLLSVVAPANAPDKLEELEVIFNSVVFMKYLYEYMTESGYKLFDFVKVEVDPLGGPNQRVAVKFYWPSPDEVREDFTVRLDTQERKIIEVFSPRAEIPLLARLTALNAETYRVNYVITKQVTYIGRLRNVTDKETGHMLRRNDFIFARHPDPMSTNSSVSRLHAKIIFENDQFYLYDTGSANGTSIMRGGETIELPRAETKGELLKDGDIINFGTAQVSFQLVSSEEAASLASMPEERLREEIADGMDSTFKIEREDINKEMKKV